MTSVPHCTVRLKLHSRQWWADSVTESLCVSLHTCHLISVTLTGTLPVYLLVLDAHCHLLTVLSPVPCLNPSPFFFFFVPSSAHAPYFTVILSCDPSLTRQQLPNKEQVNSGFPRSVLAAQGGGPSFPAQNNSL